MKERIRFCLAAAFYYSGLVKVALWWKWRRRRHLVVLCYHRAAGGHLRGHMQYLRRHYRVRSLDAALHDLYRGSPAVDGTAPDKEDGSDRRLVLAVTFDDAYRDIHTHALRYARELHVPITVFPVVGYAESGVWFWWLAPDYLVHHTRLKTVVLDGADYRLDDEAQRALLRDVIIERLIAAPSVKEREAFLAQLERTLEVPLPTRADSSDDFALPANWDELLELARSDWVSFGAHTLHHPVLAHLADVAELRREVRESRGALEERLGRRIATFAYPIGKLSDIGELAVEAVRDAGYSWAVTTVEGVNTRETDRYLLKRLPGDIAVHPLVLASELAGLLGIMSRLRRRPARS